MFQRVPDCTQLEIGKERGIRWWCVGQTARSAATRAKFESHLFLLKYRLKNVFRQHRCCLRIDFSKQAASIRGHSNAYSVMVYAPNGCVRASDCRRCSLDISERQSVRFFALCASNGTARSDFRYRFYCGRRRPRGRPLPPFSRDPERGAGRRSERVCMFESTMKPIASSHVGIAR
jgi:hypothetical protein